AKVRGVVDEAALARWQSSIDIDGKATQPAEVRKLRVEADKTWVQVTLREGKNRQIHRIGEEAGNPVLRLARISFAGIDHEGLKPGQWRYLSKDELTLLKNAHGVPKKVRPAPPLPNAKNVRKKRAEGNQGLGVAGTGPRRGASKPRSAGTSTSRGSATKPRSAGTSTSRSGATKPRTSGTSTSRGSATKPRSA